MKSLQNEERLISKAKEGDNQSFEILAFHYLGLINKLSSQYKAAGYDTGDFTQEGLMVLVSAIKSYDPSKNVNFKNYALMCIKRRFYSIVKMSQSGKTIPQECTVPLEDIEITDENLNPETQTLYRERLAYLSRKAKDNLSQREYQVLVLFVKGHSYKEISSMLGVSEKSVGTALARGKKKLLKLL